MIHLILKGTRTIYTPGDSHLTLNYFLTKSYDQGQIIYGIQIHSYSQEDSNLIHCESVTHISYHLSYANNIIRLCIQHLVTPTDLLSAIDLLMDTATK